MVIFEPCRSCSPREFWAISSLSNRTTIATGRHSVLVPGVSETSPAAASFTTWARICSIRLCCCSAGPGLTAGVRRERSGVQVDDAFDVVLHYDGALHVILRATMLACAPGPRFTLHGTAGSFTKFGMDPQENQLKAGKLPLGPDWGQDPEILWGTLTTCGPEAAIARPVPTEPGDYRLFYANVRDAILGIAPLAVTPHQAIQVIRLIELALESSRRQATLNV